MDIHAFFDSLVEQDGIYFARSASSISYPEHGNQTCFEIEDASFWFRHRNDCIAQAVKKYVGSSLFFDIGGGNGFVAKRLQDEGMACVLLEPGRAGAQNARQRAVKYVVCATLQEAGVKANSIPAAGLFDVLEHIEDDVDFLKELREYMTRDGVLLLTVPAHQGLWSQQDLEAGHFRRYSRRASEAVLERAGFNIVYSTYIFSLLPPAIFLVRSLPYRLGLREKPSPERGAEVGYHDDGRGVVSKLMAVAWRWERRRIACGMRIGFGGTCLVVARSNR